MDFPAFVFGGEELVIARAPAEGAAWLAAWRETGALPASALRPIEPGELVIVDHGSPDPFTPHWRLAGATFAMSAAMHGLAEPEKAAFSAFVREMPWGALSECARLRPPNTVESVTERARALFAVWEQLATLRYIGHPTELPAMIAFPGLGQPTLTLDQLVAELFAGPLEMWGPPLGSSRSRLEHALEQMATATPEDARGRLVERMAAFARTNKRLRGSPADDPHAIAAYLAAEDCTALIAGVSSDLLTALHQLARS